MKSTATSALGVEQRLGVGDDLEVATSTPATWRRSSPAWMRVDGGHQLEVGVGDHGPAHRAAHAPARPEHPTRSAMAGGYGAFRSCVSD